jgi:hypothetical protein
VNYVYLDSKYNEFFVADEAYKQIVELVMAHKYCVSDYRHRHPFAKENPCVGKNICLEHLLQKQPHLVFSGQVATDSNAPRMYRFLDTKGMVYTSIEDSSEEAKQSIADTLFYYGFTPPETVVARGKAVTFYSHYATLYGDLHNASVIVLSYNHYSEKVKGLFLLYKGGKTVELTKRSDLYRRAEELVEASKDAAGEYHINGTSHFGRFEADVYEVISQLESAMYDVMRKLHTGNQSTDKRTGGASE